jgi:preprotein translocase subunit Sec61beta
MEESDGERWLINPALVVANPKRKRGRKMALRRRRSRRNRMPAGLARYWAIVKIGYITADVAVT